MKKYLISRTIMIIETAILLVLFFMIRKETFVESSLSSTINYAGTKAVSKEIIQKKQIELFTENNKKNVVDQVINKRDYEGNSLYKFTGELTGYSGDCPLCSGYLACPPRTNVLKSGIYYNDTSYGNIRIVASSKNYPCGTILRFNVKKIAKEPIFAIVLDRGVSGNVIDLLTDSSESAIKDIGRVKNLEFEVLREGWK